MEFTDRLVQAFQVAHDLHRNQTRKGSELPYMTHLMGVAAIVGDYCGTEDQVIAALLHDAAEDQGGVDTLERIDGLFGPDVAALVSAASDSITLPKPPWRERKTLFITRLAEADPEQKLVVAADKLHNVRALIRDLDHRGNHLWPLFKGGREGTLWYYGEVVRALATGWNHPIMKVLCEEVDVLMRKAAQLQREETDEGAP